MNQGEAFMEDRRLQTQVLDLKARLELAQKGAAWFAAQPGGTESDARSQIETLSREIQQIESQRSGLLQQILSAPFGGE